MPELRTQRLLIRSFTLDLVRAALSDRNELAGLLDAEVPADWPGPDFGEILPLFLSDRERDPSGAEWSGLIIHQADRLLIGDIGFKGGPDRHGVTEIGYSIIPAYRGQGYAGEAARAMIVWAFAQPGVGKIAAECLADNHASIRVLEKLGMRRAAEEETEDGPMIRWELPRA